MSSNLQNKNDISLKQFSLFKKIAYDIKLQFDGIRIRQKQLLANKTKYQSQL